MKKTNHLDNMNTDAPSAPAKATELACGIVMPISAQPGCPPEHWAEVRTIIEESVALIETPTFQARLVSDADDVGVIQKRIVQNIYSSEIVVCDVSCKNANVMFELGMRLAFDKPTVIIKDDQTDYSFDTGIIEHLTYPRDLRFSKIVSFKKALAEKVKATYLSSLDAKNSTFLKNFGTFHVASLAQADASPDQIALEMLSDLQAEMAKLRSEMRRTSSVERPRSKKSDAEVASRIQTLVREYLKMHGLSKAAGLDKDDQFVDWIESKLPAGDYYFSRQEFVKSLALNLELFDLF